MSLIQPAQPTPAPLSPQQIALNQTQRALQRATAIAKSPANILKGILQMMENPLNLLWVQTPNDPSEPTPQMILNTLQTIAISENGTASDLFRYTSALFTVLESEAPGCTASLASLIKPSTINSDGSVTVNIST